MFGTKTCILLPDSTFGILLKILAMLDPTHSSAVTQATQPNLYDKSYSTPL